MDSVFRAAVVYCLLWLLFRIAGKRSLSEITTFDFVLLLIISEATQSALASSDNSMTNSILLIVTLLGIDISLSLWKQYSPRVEKLIDGVPLVILEDGHLHQDRMNKARIDEGDILAAARESHGLRRLDEIQYAILERSGGISVVPKESAR
jgi:uncharacterized membrane protein YcaP (DUF421 family)